MQPSLAAFTIQFSRWFFDCRFVAQRNAKRAYLVFLGIRRTQVFKKLERDNDIYSARIGLDYCAPAVVRKDHIVW